MTTHDELYVAAQQAIQRVHADTSVSPEKTLETLQTLQEEIEELMVAVETDIENAAE